MTREEMIKELGIKNIAESKWTEIYYNSDGSVDTEKTTVEVDMVLFHYNSFNEKKLKYFNSTTLFWEFCGDNNTEINGYSIDSDGNVAVGQNIYTKKGLPIRKVSADDVIFDFEFDADGNYTRMYRNGELWELAEYDSKGNLVYHKLNDTEEHATYDKNNNITSIISNDGTKRFWEYDEKGNVVYTKSIYSDGKVVETLKSYNEHNDLISEKTIKDGIEDSVKTYTYEYEYY